MSAYKIEVAFNVDDGELTGVKPEMVFVLGVEYGQVYTLAKQPQAFTILVHAENKDRIVSLLVTKGRQLSATPDDFGFVTFKVKGLD